MEGKAFLGPAGNSSGRSEVDTSRPFRSVKEAVAIFGDRLLSGEAYSHRKQNLSTQKPQYSPPSPSYSTSSSRFNQAGDEELETILASMKKLESELEDTKREVALLKNRESQTEMAIASLNADLYKSKARLAEVEAAGGTFMEERRRLRAESDLWADEEKGGEEEIVTDGRYEHLPSLAAALKLERANGEADEMRRAKAMMMKKKKKKPVVPLIGDLFSRKKGSDDPGDSLYSSLTSVW